MPCLARGGTQVLQSLAPPVAVVEHDHVHQGGRLAQWFHERVADGKKPICVESCPLRALDFGPIDELRQKHGQLAAVAPLPSAHFTKPSIVIKPNANARPCGDTTGYLANPKEV